MPKFLTIGYGDEAGYQATEPALRDRAHAHDARLLAQGAVMSRAGEPIQVRNTGGTGVQTQSGPFLQARAAHCGFRHH